MVNAIEADLASASESRIGSYKSRLLTRTTDKAYYQCLGYRQTLKLVLLCLTLSFASATAKAQDISIHTHAGTTTSSGWWSLQTTSPRKAPHLVLTLADQSLFWDSGSNRTSTAIASSYRSTEWLDSTLVNLGSPGLASNARAEELSFPPDGELPSPTSFLSLVQTEYMRWESRLGDTVTPTSERGMLVYPIMQIDFAGGSLPISLYIPPLRGSDTR